MTRFLLALSLMALVTNALADVAQAPSCTKLEGWMIRGPLVPNPDAAKGIYRAVAKGLSAEIRPSNVVTVTDAGDNWVVSQFPPAHGTLEIGIDKCTGAMRAYYDR